MAGNSQKTAKRKRGTGRPFTKDDPRINRSGRPQGFGSLIREKTRDGQVLVDFALAVLHADVDALEPAYLAKERKEDEVSAEERVRARLAAIPDVRNRLEAKRWLSDQGWGKAPTREEARNEYEELADQELLDTLAKDEAFVAGFLAARERVKAVPAPSTETVQ